MDYSILLMISKYDSATEEKVKKEGRQEKYVIFSKNKNYIITLGIIDYLQIFNFQRQI